MDCGETKTSSIFCGAKSDDNFHNTLSNQCLPSACNVVAQVQSHQPAPQAP